MLQTQVDKANKLTELIRSGAFGVYTVLVVVNTNRETNMRELTEIPLEHSGIDIWSIYNALRCNDIDNTQISIAQIGYGTVCRFDKNSIIFCY